MDKQTKKTLIALINGLCNEIGNQYYSEKVIKEQEIKTLIKFIEKY